MKGVIVRGLRGWIATLAALALVAAAATDASAQLNTQHVKGSVGLKAGSQPPPGGYIVLPVFYIYNSDTIVAGDGHALPGDVELTSMFFAAGYSHIATKKILGGLYGFSVLFPAGANNRIQGTEIDQNPGAGLTDSVLAPISLGWHGKRADATASFSIYVPTGRYTDGASNNTGLGMWGYEPAAGVTVYLNEKKQYHAATMLSLDFQSKKEDSDTKVGNQLNLEGGIGGDFRQGRLSLGLDYYAAFKISDDVIEGIPGLAPSLLRLPTGCAFHPRCPHGQGEAQRTIRPEAITLPGGRTVACHLYSEEGHKHG